MKGLENVGEEQQLYAYVSVANTMGKGAKASLVL